LYEKCALAARAQEPADRVRRIGVLMLQAEDALWRSYIAAFEQVLRQRGWAIGQNVQIDERWAAGDTGRLRGRAKELLGLKPDIMVTTGAIPLSVLREAAPSLPIVFAGITEPVIGGFVESLSRPGGNITGFTNFEYAMAGKWLEMIKEIAPRMTTVGLMQHPQNADWPGYNDAIKRLSSTHGLVLVSSPVRDLGEVERAIAMLGREPDRGLIVLPDAFLIANLERLIGLAAQHRVPAVYPFRLFPAAGGLMSYGPELTSVWRGAATYVDRILRGEKPADLPVQGPTKFELVINRKTAKTLGLTVPEVLLVSADQVIE
jgi:putative tryptophan/tyrosine transport system substrate-binding protein